MSAAVAVALTVAVLPVASAGAAVTCGAEPTHPGGDWPSYGADLRNSRSQPLETTIGPGNVADLGEVWSFDAAEHAGGAINTTPIVAGGCVFVVPSSGEVHALDAETGAAVWSRQLEAVPEGYGGGAVGAPAVAGDQLVVVINRRGSPYLAGLDVATGEVRWTTVIDQTESAITNASVTVFEGMAFVGFSGSSGGNPVERGGFVVVDVSDEPGTVLAKTRTIPDEDFAAGYGGASVWSTAAVDTATKHAYVGAGNPHSPRLEHPHTDAILKIDLDRTRPTFGQIVAAYKGRPDSYVDGLADQPACENLPPLYYYPGAGFNAMCAQLDLDFGASPNLFPAADGTTLVGGLQKAGVYHAVDTTTMQREWEWVGGVPCFACNASSPAFDGERVHVAAGPPGQLWALDGDSGGLQWGAPLASLLHYFSVSTANGVVYTTDTYGFLNAFDAESGRQLLKHKMVQGRGGSSATGSSGVAIARNTVYAATGSRVFAYRPQAGAGPVPEPPDPPPLPEDAVPWTVAAGPGAQFSGYAPPAVVVPVGAPLQFANGDIALHDVVARGAFGADDQPWCGRYPAGKCPLFWSPLAGLGATAAVSGTDQLVAGTTYEFTCSLHSSMRGTLVAVE